METNYFVTKLKFVYKLKTKLYKNFVVVLIIFFLMF